MLRPEPSLSQLVDKTLKDQEIQAHKVEAMLRIKEIKRLAIPDHAEHQTIRQEADCNMSMKQEHL
tara:strand:+ start:200 stop:394 length:195 start_codon:yes stop_codon:yes gene_type:complete